jgi:hypothetical protein
MGEGEEPPEPPYGPGLYKDGKGGGNLNLCNKNNNTWRATNDEMGTMSAL